MRRCLFALTFLIISVAMLSSMPQAPDRVQAQLPICSPSDFFCDDFNGTSLDTTKWETSILTSGPRFTSLWVLPPSGTSYGSAVVAGSEVMLSNPTVNIGFPIFPFFWSKVNPFPMAGDFELTLRVKYDSLGFWGPGIQVYPLSTPYTVPVPGSSSPLPFPPNRIAFIWGDPCGLRAHLFGGDSCSGLVDLAFHTYTLRYQSGQYRLFRDGVLLEGPVASPLVPNSILVGNGAVGCCGTPGFAWSSFRVDFIRVNPLMITVAIDIRPGGYPNSINLFSEGVVPVAVLTTPTFNAATVVVNSASFAGSTPPVQSAFQDADGDGDLDLMLHFRTQTLNLDCSSTQGMVMGQTTSGVQFQGMDSVRIVRDKNGQLCP